MERHQYAFARVAQQPRLAHGLRLAWPTPKLPAMRDAAFEFGLFIRLKHPLDIGAMPLKIRGFARICGGYFLATKSAEELFC